MKHMGKIQAPGKQIIKVEHLSMKEFDQNPNIIWNYDVLMHGTWDANGWNSLSNNSVDVIGRYIDAGKGVISGHDTIGSIFGKKFGISRIAEKFNIVRGIAGIDPNLTGYDLNYSWSYYSNKVKIVKKGFLTQFPWNLGPVRNSIKYSNSAYFIEWRKGKHLDGI